MTSSLGISDIDSLTLAVRNPEAQRLISEAIAAYRGGALRSALISTWIAVAYDIIMKIRELADQGECMAKNFVDRLDKAIEAKNKEKLQKIEQELVSQANALLLLMPHEKDALARLQQDRNLCAHPAFAVKDELYQPSPELVRAHIVHALQYLLVHAPLQGKSAIARFEADLLSATFPTTADEIGTFVWTRYLERAKDVLVVNLIKAIVSAPFGEEHAKYLAKARTLALTLREIARKKTAIYESVMPHYVQEKFEHVPENVLLAICPYLGNDPRIYSWLKESDKIRIQQLLKKAEVEILTTNAAFDVLPIAPLTEILLKRFESFDRGTQAKIAAEYLQKEFVQPIIKMYAQAMTYRDVDEIGNFFIWFSSEFFSSEDVGSVLEAISNNNLIFNSYGTDRILCKIFDMTISLLPQTHTHWKNFFDTKKIYADNHYPELTKKLSEFL